MDSVLTKDNYEQLVLKNEKDVLIDFWASWCGPCKMIAPIVEEIAQKNERLQLFKVNVDDEPELAEKFEVRYVPTLFLIKGGKLISQTSGYHSEREILAFLES